MSLVTVGCAFTPIGIKLWEVWALIQRRFIVALSRCQVINHFRHLPGCQLITGVLVQLLLAAGPKFSLTKVDLLQLRAQTLAFRANLVFCMIILH